MVFDPNFLKPMKLFWIARTVERQENAFGRDASFVECLMILDLHKDYRNEQLLLGAKLYDNEMLNLQSSTTPYKAPGELVSSTSGS